jgi:hypothetical protein
MHVAREAIELGDRYRATQCPCLRERCRELRATIERVASLASLNLDERRSNALGISFGEGRAARSRRASTTPNDPAADRMVAEMVVSKLMRRRPFGASRPTG